MNIMDIFGGGGTRTTNQRGIGAGGSMTEATGGLGGLGGLLRTGGGLLQNAFNSDQSGPDAPTPSSPNLMGPSGGQPIQPGDGGMGSAMNLLGNVSPQQMQMLMQYLGTRRG